MLSVSYAGKNAYSAGKTSGVLRGGASGANRCYVLAHCGGGVSGVLDNVQNLVVFFFMAPLSVNRWAKVNKYYLGN